MEPQLWASDLAVRNTERALNCHLLLYCSSKNLLRKVVKAIASKHAGLSPP